MGSIVVTRTVACLQGSIHSGFHRCQRVFWPARLWCKRQGIRRGWQPPGLCGRDRQHGAERTTAACCVSALRRDVSRRCSGREHSPPEDQRVRPVGQSEARRKPTDYMLSYSRPGQRQGAGLPPARSPAVGTSRCSTYEPGKVGRQAAGAAKAAEHPRPVSARHGCGN